MEHLKFTNILHLILKIVVYVPITSFGCMIASVAVIGSIYDHQGIRELLGGTSGLPVFYTWLVILYPIFIYKHFCKKAKKEKF